MTRLRIYQIKNSNENVLTFFEMSSILIFEINLQSFNLFLKLSDSSQSSIDLNFNLILSFIQSFNVVFQFFVEFQFQISFRYDEKIDNNACLKRIEKIRNYIDFYDKRDDNFSKTYKISLIAFYLKNLTRTLGFVRKIKSNSLSSNHSNKIEILKAFFAVIRHAYEHINKKERRRFERCFLCQIISVRKYSYVLLQLIERLFFKLSSVKIKKIFKIEIKNYLREILFRIYN